MLRKTHYVQKLLNHNIKFKFILKIIKTMLFMRKKERDIKYDLLLYVILKTYNLMLFQIQLQITILHS